MTGFDLPPVVGFDRLFKEHAQMGEGGLQGPSQKALQIGDERPEVGGAQGPDSPFAETLAKSIDQVRELQDDVKHKYEGLMLGEDVELHDIMAAANKSEVAFNLMLEVRNKLVDAWEKLSRSTV